MGFRSGFERTIDFQLKATAVKYEYETVKVPYILENEYTPDFYFPDHGFYIEVKGFLDYDDRRKHLAVQRQHPELDIRFIFMAAHKKMPRLKSTHAQWATKHGFLWADMEVPKEWFDGSSTSADSCDLPVRSDT